MKKYNTPIAEVSELETHDVITFSIPDVNAQYDDVEDADKVSHWFK